MFIENKTLDLPKSLSYMDIIENKLICKNKIAEKIKTKKKNINNDSIVMPNYDNIEKLFDYNYNIQQLKIFSKHYKLKTSGTKKQLLIRIYNFIYLSKYIVKIQKKYRTFLHKKYNILKGPALFNRNICNNNNDFLTFEEIKDINDDQFFSYCDNDNFIYGFDILSIYNLIFTEKTKNYVLNDKIKNPYNRNDIPLKVIADIKTILRIGKIIKKNVNVKIKDINDDISYQKSLELKALELFQCINSLGNYSDVNWFLNLNKNKLIRLIRELYDIWNFRSQIYPNVKRAICPPDGNPFRNVNILHLNNINNIFELKKIILNVLENFVYSGSDRENKNLGSLYVLSALTLVSENAANTIPWLFESVSNDWNSLI